MNIERAMKHCKIQGSLESLLFSLARRYLIEVTNLAGQAPEFDQLRDISSPEKIEAYIKEFNTRLHAHIERFVQIFTDLHDLTRVEHAEYLRSNLNHILNQYLLSRWKKW